MVAVVVLVVAVVVVVVVVFGTFDNFQELFVVVFAYNARNKGRILSIIPSI